MSLDRDLGALITLEPPVKASQGLTDQLFAAQHSSDDNADGTLHRTCEHGPQHRQVPLQRNPNQPDSRGILVLSTKLLLPSVPSTYNWLLTLPSSPPSCSGPSPHGIAQAPSTLKSLSWPPESRGPLLPMTCSHLFLTHCLIYYYLTC